MSTAETARAASAARRLALTAPAAVAPRSATTRTQRRRATRRALVAVAALTTVLATVAVASPVGAQSADGGSDEVRIVARKLADGRIEFALRQHQGGDSWGDPLLPRARFFPADATVGRWLRSSPLTIIVAATTDRAATEAVVRIVARKVADGRVEFALRKQLSSSTYSAPLLPQARFFPTTATVGRWLQSTPISVITTQPTAVDDTAAEPCVAAPIRGEYRWCVPPESGNSINLFYDFYNRSPWESPDFERYVDSGVVDLEEAFGGYASARSRPLILDVGTKITRYNVGAPDDFAIAYFESVVTGFHGRLAQLDAWHDEVYGIYTCTRTALHYDGEVWPQDNHREGLRKAYLLPDGRWRVDFWQGGRPVGEC